jgi:hypothetical protein
MTLQPKAMWREPQAIDENLRGSRTPKLLNLLHCSETPGMGRVPIAAQATGARRVRHNMQHFQAL